MIERIKRLPIVARHIRKKHPYYGTCGMCNLPWSACEKHLIPLDNCHSFFPVCEWCWMHKSKLKNGVEVIRLWMKWEREGAPYSIGEMLVAFDKEWELTHK